MREGERTASSFCEMGGHALSSLRLNATGEKTLCVRLECARWRSRADLHRNATFLRHVRHRKTALALIGRERSYPPHTLRTRLPREEYENSPSSPPLSFRRLWQVLGTQG